MRSLLLISLYCTAAFVLLGARVTAQGLLSFPPEFEAVEAPNSRSDPFSSPTGSRAQLVIDSSAFSSQEPIVITQIEFRSDDDQTFWSRAEYPDLLVRMGPSRNDYAIGSYSSTFDNNWAVTQPHVFFQGPHVIEAGSRGPRPSGWLISVAGAPFHYDPLAGQDLIIELRTLGGAVIPGGAMTIDGFNTNLRSPIQANYLIHYSDPNATRASSGGGTIPVVRIHYGSATSVQSDFTASPSQGDAPLSVQFRDASYTSAPGGIQTWAWDFQNDGIVDSNAQAPVHVYASCGEYTVALTVTDAANGTSTRHIADRIIVDPLRVPRANFSAQPLGNPLGTCPLNVLFTHFRSSLDQQTEWDFDSDGIIDSTLTSVTWTYTTPGPHTVTLRARNACGSDEYIRRDLVSCFPIPTNDECASALPLTLGLQGPLSNRGTTSSLPPSICNPNFQGADVWFYWDAPCDGSLSVSACQPNVIDAILELMEGPSCTTAVPIACAMRNCPGGWRAEIAASVSAGVRYYLRVSGIFSAMGDFFLDSTFTATVGSIQSISPACTTFDLLANGVPSLGGEVQLSTSGAGGAVFAWLGASSWSLPLCPNSCLIDAALDVAIPAPPLTFPIPCDPTLSGARVWVQAGDLNPLAGCPLQVGLFLATSSTYEIEIG